MTQRDGLTEAMFNGNMVKISGYFREVSLPGGVLDKDALPYLVGAPDGSSIYVKKRKASFEYEISNTALFDKPVTFLLDKDNVLHPIEMYLRDDAPEGLGTRMMATSILTSKEFGIRELQLMAAGQPDNGYYTWARLGFDAPLSANEADFFSQKLGSAVSTVQELMSTEFGRLLWKEHGTGREMAFILDGSGESIKVLLKYLKEKGVEL